MDRLPDEDVSFASLLAAPRLDARPPARGARDAASGSSRASTPPTPSESRCWVSIDRRARPKPRRAIASFTCRTGTTSWCTTSRGRTRAPRARAPSGRRGDPHRVGRGRRRGPRTRRARRSAAGTLRARAALVTVPLGVLQARPPARGRDRVRAVAAGVEARRDRSAGDGQRGQDRGAVPRSLRLGPVVADPARHRLPASAGRRRSGLVERSVPSRIAAWSDGWRDRRRIDWRRWGRPAPGPATAVDPRLRAALGGLARGLGTGARDCWPAVDDARSSTGPTIPTRAAPTATFRSAASTRPRSSPHRSRADSSSRARRLTPPAIPAPCMARSAVARAPRARSRLTCARKAERASGFGLRTHGPDCSPKCPRPEARKRHDL